MKGQLIELTDDSKIEIKVNFGTLYYLQQIGGYELARRIEKKRKKKREISDSENMEFSAKLIYATLRSNGREVTFEEALSLMPSDMEQLEKVFDAYCEEVKRLKKKQESKKNMKKFTQT